MASSISLFGLGYVGAVTASCLASKGHRVIGVDVATMKVDALKAGRSPIVEEGVDDLVAAGVRAGLLSATTDAVAAIQESEISFISVGTPSLRNGKLDLSHVAKVCGDIGRALKNKRSFHWIVVRSTVLPGTTESFLIPALETASGKRANRDFGVCFNPEFLREGSAVHDFFHPPFTVLGVHGGLPAEDIRALYSWARTPIFETDPASAEMVKYACNAFHALKASFANEIGTICSEIGVEPSHVMDIFKTDTRLNISTAYLSPGFAFGGSCLPKDVRALNYRAKELDLALPLLQAILPSNAEHITRAVDAVLRTGRRHIGVLGLSFKPGTDDLRESPMVYLVKRLLGEGCQLTIWDRDVALGRLIGSNRQFIEEVIPHVGVLLCPDLASVLDSSDVVLLGTTAVEKDDVLSQLSAEQLLIDLLHIGSPEPGRRLVRLAVATG